jgi:hypothetical protein
MTSFNTWQLTGQPKDAAADAQKLIDAAMAM